MSQREKDPFGTGPWVYNRLTLRLYDPLVVGYNNRFVWRCPSSRILAHYNQHVSMKHLEVGPGTGYFLDHCSFPGPKPAITLMDVNAGPLARSAWRLRRYHPLTVQASVTERLPSGFQRFDSIGINYVLHLLPGTMQTKAAAIEHLHAHLYPGGVFFGSTVVGEGANHSRQAQGMLRLFNSVGGFSNTQDSVADLTAALRRIFAWHDVRVVGSVALFAGRC